MHHIRDQPLLMEKMYVSYLSVSLGPTLGMNEKVEQTYKKRSTNLMS